MPEAIRLHQSGNLDAAEDLYRRILKTDGTQADALHFLGVLLHRRGQSDEAVQLIERAIVQAPAYADAHNNLGNIHKECERLAQAESCYRRALDCDPDHYNALSNLALVLEALKRYDEALLAHQALTQRSPRYPRGWLHFAQFIRRRATSKEHLVAAVSCLKNAITLSPEDLEAYSELGVVLHQLGERDEAVAVYRKWLAREPDNPVALHRLAACGGAAPPPRAANDYISTVFDQFADSFDELLLHKLSYRAPQALVEALTPLLPAPAAGLDILDAGCGTGLCGPLIRPWAKRLSGVDLSGGMLEKARPRQVYDVLEVAELTAYLRAHAAAYDLVLSADTLVYFGALDEVSAAMFAALRPGGWIGFTIEARDDAGDVVHLAASGRYSHSRRHVAQAFEAAGFSELQIEPSVLRSERGEPVHGWIVTARRCRNAENGFTSYPTGDAGGN